MRSAVRIEHETIWSVPAIVILLESRYDKMDIRLAGQMPGDNFPGEQFNNNTKIKPFSAVQVLYVGLLTNKAVQKRRGIFPADETKSAGNTLCINEHFCKICRNKAPKFSNGGFVNSPYAANCICNY